MSDFWCLEEEQTDRACDFALNNEALLNTMNLL